MKKLFKIDVCLTEQEYLGISAYLQQESDTIITREEVGMFVEDEIVKPFLSNKHHAVVDFITE